MRNEDRRFNLALIGWLFVAGLVVYGMHTCARFLA